MCVCVLGKQQFAKGYKLIPSCVYTQHTHAYTQHTHVCTQHSETIMLLSYH